MNVLELYLTGAVIILFMYLLVDLFGNLTVGGVAQEMPPTWAVALAIILWPILAAVTIFRLAYNFLDRLEHPPSRRFQ